ncbi:MAG: alpha/beta hydrolase-fold protein [Bacteroidota bacterium]
MQESHTKFYSHHLGHDVDVLIYGDRGYPVVIFPTTLGRYYEAKDFGLIESASWFIEQGLVQIYCPDSVNHASWYGKVHPAERVARHHRYDEFLYNEFIPQIRWKTGTGKIVAAGASFGGFSAANFAFRHPEYVSHLFSMSGSFDIKSFMSDYYSNEVYFHNPVDFVPGLDHPDIWKMKIILGTSEWDICREPTETFSAILNKKGINHWLDMRGWKEHDWPLWKEMFPHYLSMI